MAESTGVIEPIADRVRTGTIVRFVLGGAGLGALMGAVISAFEYFLHGRGVRDIALTTFLIVYPAVGAILGWFTGRNPAGHGWKRPAGFFATGPLSEEERETRGRRVRKSVWIGFGGGIAVGLATSALDFAWRGWPYLSGTLGSGLFFFPYFGACLGRNLGLRPGDPKPSIRDLRFNMRTLMILTAYLAVWLALVGRTSGISGAARTYLAKSQSARAMTAVFQKILDESIADAKRSGNADELRAGRIPDGLDASQKVFLKSLDQTATEEYREYRYGLIADGEQRRAELGAENVKEYTRIVDYEKALAEKYAKAAQEPWLAVEPDPPRPLSIFPANNPPPAPKVSPTSP
jgi:hypothetical protein